MVRGLLTKGEAVHVLTARLTMPMSSHWPAAFWRSAQAGDSARAMKGSIACLVSPLSPTGERGRKAAIAAATRAGVRHLVYLSAYHV